MSKLLTPFQLSILSELPAHDAYEIARRWKQIHKTGGIARSLYALCDRGYIGEPGIGVHCWTRTPKGETALKESYDDA